MKPKKRKYRENDDDQTDQIDYATHLVSPRSMSGEQLFASALVATQLTKTCWESSNPAMVERNWA